MTTRVAAAPRVVPTLDEIAADPERAIGLARGALLALNARAVRALAALQAPLSSVELSDPAAGVANDELLDARATAVRLQVKESWVRDMARQGKLPSVRLGRYVRFRASDLDGFVAQHMAA